MSIVTLNEGAMFAGRYKVVRCIAAGGMGAVYEVVHVETERHRALKVMLPHLVQSDDLRERFRREARVAAKVDSAYIVDVFDAGIDEATQMPFLVMELLQGEELGKRLRRAGRFGFEETVGYLWQTALALDKTHRANIVHRDLKPENLFLCENEEGPARVKVLDFGIAKLVAEGGTQANATRAMGTPLYMAPEQFRSKSKVSSATDIYSLGMMAYTLLVGAPYWADEQATEENPYAFAGLVMHGPPEPPVERALRRGVRLPEAFDEWFGQATSPNPEQRFFKATVAIKGLAMALGVSIPLTSAGHVASSTDPQGSVAGQTTPGQTGVGQTGSGSASSGSGSSGPLGTVMLESTSSPATNSPTNESGTHASGYGLSSSQPKVASVPSVPPLDTATNFGREAPKRGKTLPMVMGALIVLAALGMGLFALGGKNKEPTADAATAILPSVASPTMMMSVVPAVVPESPIDPAASAKSVVEPTASAVDAGVVKTPTPQKSAGRTAPATTRPAFGE